MATTLYTASGIIRDADKPRVGVVSQRRLSEWFFDDMGSWVDLGYEQLLADVTDEVRAELGEDADESDVEAEVEERCQDIETNGPYLLGDWRKDAAGLYEPDTAGTNGFAATYSPESGNICVEWSRYITLCHHTSPCYVMADGRGPCGDLDTAGDAVVAYTLPADAFHRDVD